MRRRAGDALLLGAVLLVVGSLAAGAALAPDRAVAAGDDRLTLVGIQGDGPGLHEGGAVVLYDGDGEVVWSHAGADSYFDVTWLEDGRVAAAFMRAGATDCGPYPAPCARTGFEVIDPDPAPHVVRTFSFPVRRAQNSEVHDVEALGDGRFLVADMARERLLLVAANDTVVWEWHADELYTPPDDPTREDWLHVNDVDAVGDGQYLVSVRNAHELVLVNREGPTGVLADGDAELFTRQHNPQWLGPGAVLVADSHGDRVVELHRGAAGWTTAWSLSGAGGLAFDWPRDADRLPGGTTLVTDSVNRRVVEVDADGEVVWSVATDGTPYEADRVPVGETVGGPRYGADGLVEPPARTRLPVVAGLYAALRPALPLPYWVSAWHLLALLLAAPLAVAGGWLRRTAPPR